MGRRTPKTRGRKVVELALVGALSSGLVSARVANAQDTTPPAGAAAPTTTPATKTPDPGAAPEGPPSPAPPPPPGPSPAEEALKAEQAQLKADLAQLKDDLDVTQAILGAEREQRAEEVVGLREKLEKAEAALKKPPVFTAKGGVGVTGYVQADWAMWRQSSEDQINSATGAPINEQRFNLRRARLKTTLEKTYVSGALELDGNTNSGTQARLIGAEASVRLPGEEGAPVPLLMATMGLFKIPFGFEVIQSDRDRIFLERSNAEQALFPGEYDLGARLQGGWRFVRYAFAVQNGDPLGEKAFPGRDPNAAKDFTGRLGVDAPITDNVSVIAGFSGLHGTGFHKGTPATKPSLQWSDRNENGQVDANEIVAVNAVAATPSQNFSRFGYGADLGLTVQIPSFGAATAYGEIYVAQDLDRARLVADPIGVGRDYREIGGYVGGLLDIGDHATVGARWDKYNPDRDSTDPAKALVPTDVSVGTLAFVAALRDASGGRLTLEYDHNTNHAGRDAAGNPTRLKDDAVLLRGQVAF